MSAKLLLVIFMLSVTPVAGQTVAKIEGAYGKPTLAYSVTEHVWMNLNPSADDFQRVDTEIVTVRWPHRTCAGH